MKSRLAGCLFVVVAVLLVSGEEPRETETSVPEDYYGCLREAALGDTWYYEVRTLISTISSLPPSVAPPLPKEPPEEAYETIHLRARICKPSQRGQHKTHIELRIHVVGSDGIPLEQGEFRSLVLERACRVPDGGESHEQAVSQKPPVRASYDTGAYGGKLLYLYRPFFDMGNIKKEGRFVIDWTVFNPPIPPKIPVIIYEAKKTGEGTFTITALAYIQLRESKVSPDGKYAYYDQEKKEIVYEPGEKRVGPFYPEPRREIQYWRAREALPYEVIRYDHEGRLWTTCKLTRFEKASGDEK
jgi:hypothetical protein